MTPARATPREPLSLRGGRNLIPRFAIFGAIGDDPTIADDDDLATYRGAAIVFSWLGLVIDLTLTRRVA